MKDFLNEKTQTRIRRAIENADYSQPDARKKLISYIKPILYNNKEMIIKTRKNAGLDDPEDDDNDDADNDDTDDIVSIEEI